MNETLSTIEFTTRIPANEAIEALQEEGAIAIHNFLPEEQLRRTAYYLSKASMRLDESLTDKVPRRQELAKYAFVHDQDWLPQVAGLDMPSSALFDTVRKMDRYFMEAPGIDWQPNEIIGHRYNPGDFIGKHKDFSKDALGYIAVLTVAGSQVFGFERDNGDEVRVTMRPGTLTLMRGYQTGAPNERPRHWVESATEQRLAVGLRQKRFDWD